MLILKWDLHGLRKAEEELEKEPGFARATGQGLKSLYSSILLWMGAVTYSVKNYVQDTTVTHRQQLH